MFVNIKLKKYIENTYKLLHFYASKICIFIQI